MVDMEEREMGELFLGNKEEGVKHVKKLGHVKQPGQIQSPKIKTNYFQSLEIPRILINDQFRGMTCLRASES